MEYERLISRCWRTNAGAWTDAVRSGGIASRVRVTDRVLIEAIEEAAPATLLDIGCGEGWLVREMTARGVDALGVDGSAELVAAALQHGGAFHTLNYHELAEGIDRRRDLALCNFSLIGRESSECVFAAMPRLLKPGGCFLVQTLHPTAVQDPEPLGDGWREGSWKGIGGDFVDPAPWYFRTTESWERLFERHGLRLVETREPRDPDTGQPASLLFIARISPTPSDESIDVD